MQTHGMWIVEIAELSAMNRTEYNQVKKFMSRQIDRFRPPYGKTVQDFPRSCVFVGTCNPGEGGYLKDPTGARRFWPVAVDRIYSDRLTEDQPQLWAEAVHLWKQGQQWWLTADEERLAEPVQKDRQEEHPWAIAIRRWCEGQMGGVRVAEILREVIKIPLERQNPLYHRIVSDTLAMQGWKRTRIDEGEWVFERVKIGVSEG